MLPSHSRRAILSTLLHALATSAHAGGPKSVAGKTFFNPGVLGQPIHWANGQLNYYVDQGPLTSSISNQRATAMVDAAAPSGPPSLPPASR
jgi:hypothetical protein